MSKTKDAKLRQKFQEAVVTAYQNIETGDIPVDALEKVEQDQDHFIEIFVAVVR